MATPLQAPNGAIRMVPEDQVDVALQSGGQRVTQMMDPTGVARWVVNDQVEAARRAGGVVAGPGAISAPGSPVQPDRSVLGIGANVADFALNGPKAEDGTPLAQQANDWADQHGLDAKNIGEGAIKGVGEGVLGMDNLVRKGLNLPIKAANSQLGTNITPYDILKPTDFGASNDDILESKNVGQMVGKVGETILEFMVGEGELKTLSESEKLTQLGKISKIMETYPAIGRILRQMVVGAAQGTIHDAGANPNSTLGENLKSGAVEGAITGAVGLGMEGLGAGADAVGDRLIKSKAAEGVSSTLKGTADDIAARSGVEKSIVTKNADGTFSVDVVKGGPPSVKDTFEEISNRVQAKAKGIFSQIDDATGGKFQPLDNELRQIAQDLKSATPETAPTLEAQQTAARAKMEAIFDQATKDGTVTADDVAKAKAAWRQAGALDDLDTAVKQSTSGMRPELANAGTINGDQYSKETVDAKKLFGRLNKLYDAGRLQDAFGPASDKQIQSIMRVVDLAQQSKTTEALLNDTLKDIGGKAIFTIGGGVLGYEKKGGVAGALEGAVAGAGSRYVLGKVLSSPTALAVLERGLLTGAKPTTIAPAVAAALATPRK